MNRIYFDNNASTPIDPHVLRILIEEIKEEVGNPSSMHFHGKKCLKKLEDSRAVISRYFKVKPHQVVFNSGGTEGAAMLLQGFLNNHSQPHVISSSAEHSCVYQTLQEVKKKGVDVTFLTPGVWGTPRPEEIEKAICPATRLIVLTAVNNETGVLTDIEAISSIAQRKNLPFILDGVAWLGKAKMAIPSGVSAAFFSGHKIHAPKGIGFCVLFHPLKLSPLLIGGSQEFNRRAGTENLSGIVALAEAIHLLEKKEGAFIDHLSFLRDLFEKELFAQLPNIQINGLGNRISNTSNLSFPHIDGESLLIALDMKGISASLGSACASGSIEPSRVLREMGYPVARVLSSLRFSFGRQNTQEEVRRAIDIIVETIGKLNRL